MEPDIDAIEAVYRSRYPTFLRLALALLGESEPTRDAVQEASARAIRARSDHRGAGTLDAWLWRTLVNVCLDERRKGRRADSLGDEPPARNGHPVEWPELRAAIAALPERQRLILFLRHYTDLDYQTIAAALDIQRGTVAATLNAAHNALRRAMTEVAR